MDKKRHGLQISGRMKLQHHHSERRQQTMFLCFYEIYSTYYNKFGQEHQAASPVSFPFLNE